MGGGMCPIPLTSILTYADYLELTRGETDDFLRVIRRLDTRSCVLVSEKAASKSARGA